MQPTVSMQCPYCGASASRVDSSRIYCRSYGLVYLCNRYPKCDAYVGCHKDGTAKGTLANRELRGLRKEAHALFDPLWKEKVFESRSAAYKWLSKEMNTSHKQTHIAMFDEQQCLKCINLLKLLYEVAQEEVAQDEINKLKACRLRLVQQALARREIF
jgi:hypothetical protein